MTNYGRTWWGSRWLNALSHIDYANRLPRGRSYANKGAVRELEVSGRKIVAAVKGTRAKPYQVTITVPAFLESEKQTLTGAILENPLLLSKLLNRELPSGLNDLSERNNIKIFPERWNDLNMHCTCPDWAVPCKHLAAVINVIANEIDRNPFLVFKLHGYDIIDELRKEGLEAVSEKVDIPGLSDIAGFDSGLAVADSDGKYAVRGTESLEEIDFSVLKGIRENLLTLLTPQPLFFSKDFKKVLDNLYKKTAREVTREKRAAAHVSDQAEGFTTSHYETYRGIHLAVTLTGQMLECEVQGKPGGYWKEMHEVGEGENWYIRNMEDLRMFISEVMPVQVSRLTPGLAYLFYVYRFTRKLAETSAFIPQLVLVDSHAYTIRWIPAVIDPVVREVFDRLAATFPRGLVSVVKEEGAGKISSWQEGTDVPLKEKLRILISMFLREFVLDGGFDKSVMSEPVYRIFFENFSYGFDGPGESEIPASIQRWIDGFYLERNGFLPVLEIFEKEDSGRFGLKVLVENNRVALQKTVPLTDVMDLPEYGTSRYEVLRSLELLSPVLPELEMIISSSGRYIPVYTPSEFAGVMFRILPVVRLYGIRVLLPHQLKNLVRPGLSLSLTSSSGVVPKSLLNLKKILAFEWKVAMGDQLMDADEFFQMVKGLSGIVKLRDQYVFLETSELTALIEHFGQQQRKVDHNRLLQAAFTGEYDGQQVEMDRATRDLIDELLHVKEVELPVGLHARLRPYQRRGFEWLYKNASLGFGSIIADDMGLGKTVQVIVVLLKLKEEGALGWGENLKRKQGKGQGQALIVVPTTLLTNWQKEFDKFAPGVSISIFHGTSRQLDESTDVVLTSYGIARSDQELLDKKRWLAVIIDEAQNIKNTATAQTRAVKKLKAGIFIAMSGTPVENRLSEYWSIFDFTNRGYLGSLKQFTAEYAWPIEYNRNKKQLDRFLQISAPFILRRLKTDRDIIKDLPDKVENDYMVSLVKEQAAIYQGVIDNIMGGIEAIDTEEKDSGIRRKGMVLKLIMALKQVCNHPSQYLKKADVDPGLSGKAGMFINLLENIIENGEKVLVFTQFREMGELLQKMIQERMGRGAMFLHGGTSRKRRDEMVERFQDHAEEKIFILSIKAGGTGLNLTAASHVIHYDLWWNPAVEIQATDRAYRIGQDKNVMVYRLITQGYFRREDQCDVERKKGVG